MNVELFVAALEPDGHDVVVVPDGLRARDLALRERYDLVILDIHMPGLDGYALCGELRAAGMRGPIIALSAAATPSDIKQAKERGFDAYLTKPISPADLRAAVRRYATTSL